MPLNLDNKLRKGVMGHSSLLYLGLYLILSPSHTLYVLYVLLLKTGSLDHWRYAPRWLSIISYPTRARGIIVK